MPTIRPPHLRSISCVAMLGIGAWTSLPLQLQAQSAKVLFCPLEGNSSLGSSQALDRLKNRTFPPSPSEMNRHVTMSALVAPGSDSHSFNASDGARITGYVVDVKVGGIESVNCEATDVDDRDTRIDLTLQPNNAGGATRVAVDVTPRLRAVMRQRGIDWTTPTLRRQLTGRWIEVTGWLLYDEGTQSTAHKTNAAKEQTPRASAWEIYPVTKLRLAKAPRRPNP